MSVEENSAQTDRTEKPEAETIRLLKIVDRDVSDQCAGLNCSAKVGSVKVLAPLWPLLLSVWPYAGSKCISIVYTVQ